MKNAYYPVVIIGAGPAGLTAAYELVKAGVKVLVIEQLDKVGGISRTETYKDYLFDIGGHRFFTKVGEVDDLWHEVLGDQFIQVPRLSRIYYKDKFYDYPLSVTNTLKNLGFKDSFLIMLSYFQAKFKGLLNKNAKFETFEEWVTHCFGERLYQTFFKTYTEKVWGIPCNKIQAEWAQQRIKGLSLKKVLLNALFSVNDTKTLIKKFNYPLLGPGMMWDKFQQLVEEKGGEVILNASVIKINNQTNHIKSITVKTDQGIYEISTDHLISSMPITTLVQQFNNSPPPEVIQASGSLSYRDFLIVALIVNQTDLFPDNWIYIHSPNVQVGRIQNFKNWSPAMVPDQSKTCIGMEYFCNQTDEIWNRSNQELITLATKELSELGLADIAKVEDGTVIRQLKAYPVYDRDYYGHLEVIRDYLEPFDNLQTVGRNGMHRYNNQDHSMLTGLLAAKNYLGENHKLWQVNTERSYHEEFTKSEWQTRKTKA